MSAECSAGNIPSGYKQTEVGVIPDDWAVVELKDVVINMVQGVNTAIDKPEYVNSGIPMLKANNVIDQEVLLDGADHISPKTFAGYSDRFKLRKNDFLFSNIGARLGTGSLLKVDIDCSFAWNVMRIVPNTKKIVPQYLSSIINSPKISQEIRNNQSGSGMGFVSKGILEKVLFPTPPKLTEQKAIAEVLSDADVLLESLERLISKKHQIKQGAMQELLKGKRRLQGFSGEWNVKRLGEFTDCTAGGTPSTKVPDYWGGTIRWMNSGELNLKIVAEVEGRITEEGLCNSSTKMIPVNCVLIGLAGQGRTRGTVAMNLVPLCTNQSIAAILPNPTFVSEYLYYNLDSRYEELRELSAGDGGRGGLNLTIIRSIIVPFPTLEEQNAIATILSGMDSEITVLEKKLAKARQIKQGMMQELLTGRIRLI